MCLFFFCFFCTCSLKSSELSYCGVGQFVVHAPSPTVKGGVLGGQLLDGVCDKQTHTLPGESLYTENPIKMHMLRTTCLPVTRVCACCVCVYRQFPENHVQLE